jgi:hypothetical protein
MGIIRESLEAPEGYFFWACDSAQIELRTNFWFCGQNDALTKLVNGVDTYLEAASEIFHEPITDKYDPRRKLGKARELGLQYRMGWSKFKDWCASGPLGMDPIVIDDQTSQTVVNSFRQSRWAIKAMWEWLDGIIPRMTDKDFRLDYKCVTFSREEIMLPSGISLKFPGLHHQEYRAWVWGTGPKLHKLHGGKLLENIIQALANVIIDEEILDIDTHYRTVSMTHDEIMGMCRYNHAASCRNLVTNIMSTSPKWAPDLPLGCEFSIGHHYMK